MRKQLKKWLPNHETIKRYRWMQPFAHHFQHPALWHLHRRSVAGGVAVGLFAGLIPGPFQMLAAALLAIKLRVNLPVALFATLYTNPFTILPLYALAYQLGGWVTGTHTAAARPDLPGQDGLSGLWQGLVALGQPILIGLPLLALLLAALGYVAVRLVWRVMLVRRWHARAARRGLSAPPH